MTTVKRIARVVIGLATLPYRRGVYVLVVGSLAYLVGFSVSTAEADSGFYAVAAQVIPVLLLVLALEARVFELRRLPSAPSGLAFGPGSFLDRLEHMLFLLRGTGPESEALAALSRVVYGTPVLAAIVIGELFSLRPLMTGVAHSGHPRPVLGAIVTGLVMIFVLSLTPGRSSPSAAPPPGSRPPDDPPSLVA